MTSNTNLSLRGSIVALITPMLENGEIDFDALKKLVHWHIEQGTNGLVVLGTTAETATLSKAEQRQVLETVIAENQKTLPIIVGNGSNSTQGTIENTQLFDEYEIDGFLTVTPYYNKPTQAGMVAHFKAVAAVTNKPIILYNVPGRTAVDLNNESVVELMSVDNIVGIKDATADLSRVAVMKDADENFLLYSGDDLTARDYVALGGDGTISVTANVEPKLMSEMIAHALNGEIEAAKSVDEKLSLLHRNLFIEPNPVPAKWALMDKGLIANDMVRLPLLPMEPIHFSAVKQALQQAK